MIVKKHQAIQQVDNLIQDEHHPQLIQIDLWLPAVSQPSEKRLIMFGAGCQILSYLPVNNTRLFLRPI